MSRNKDVLPPRILHLHSTFDAGGKELRCARLINAFGPKLHHTIVSAEEGAYGAAKAITPGANVSYPADFPSLQGKPTPARCQAIARRMAAHSLVLTYNWGAMDAVMGHTLFRDKLGLPPLIHHEDGFGEDEAQRRKLRRTWFRRIALGKSNGLVVPSETLEGIALTEWQQPIGRVKRIANGIDTKSFARKPEKDALRGVVKHDGEFWVGTVAGLRAVKNLPALVRAFAKLPEPWQLVIVGQGPEEKAIRDEAERLDISHRLHMPGFAPDPARYIGLFDIFALSSDSEQFPISLVEAMAAGLPVAAPAVGDIADMVSEGNIPYIADPAAPDELGNALLSLSQDNDLRKAVGAANCDRAREKYDEKTMIAAYRRLYSSAMRRDSLP